ncbi:Regulator of telomere elongation helicase 1 [Varanus komodoensis]|nr:Regulator of telomere elongation helicase 1 [Varanus komodoensis]
MSESGATGGSCAAESDEPSRKPPSSLKETQSQIIRSAYLSDLRTALDKSSFDQFFSALSAYKRTDDYDALVPVVVALTTEKPEHLHLLQRFSMFVRPHHKNQFKRMCKELTGMNCPCESKEVFLPAQKGLGLGGPVEESGIQDKAASAIPGLYGSKEGEKFQRTASPASDSETQKTEGGPSSSRAPTNSDSLPISAVGGFLCVKCESDGGVPLKCQLCAFTCCKACWESLLKVAKKCPRCQADTKRRHLALSYWPDPHMRISWSSFSKERVHGKAKQVLFWCNSLFQMYANRSVELFSLGKKNAHGKKYIVFEE